MRASRARGLAPRKKQMPHPFHKPKYFSWIRRCSAKDPKRAKKGASMAWKKRPVRTVPERPRRRAARKSVAAPAGAGPVCIIWMKAVHARAMRAEAADGKAVD